MPALAGPEALQLFRDDLLQPMPIEREIGHQPLQLRVFFPQLSQLTQLAQSESRILSLPQVERLLTDADLPADVHHSRPALRLPQGGQNLFLGMFTSSCHRRVLLLGKEDHVAGRFLKLPPA